MNRAHELFKQHIWLILTIAYAVLDQILPPYRKNRSIPPRRGNPTFRKQSRS